MRAPAFSVQSGITAINQFPELVFQGYNGWLCPAGDIETLVNAIKELLQTETKRLTEMGLKGRQLVMQNHNAKKEAEVIKNAIQTYVN